MSFRIVNPDGSNGTLLKKVVLLLLLLLLVGGGGRGREGRTVNMCPHHSECIMIHELFDALWRGKKIHFDTRGTYKPRHMGHPDGKWSRMCHVLGFH